MSKLYYTDLLAAAYMVREFGVRFVPNIRGYSSPASVDLTIRGEDNQSISWLMVDGELDGWNNKIGEAIKPNEKIYIHPDSYHIFEPQVGDEGKDSAGRLCRFIPNKWICWSRSGEPVYPMRIIQRNNKPFFMPEGEELDK